VDQVIEPLSLDGEMAMPAAPLPKAQALNAYGMGLLQYFNSR
jgi:hypothetical protein